jgi:hypothetical protein
MNKIGDYDLFFDFFMFQSKRWLGLKKKIYNPKNGGNLQAENFIKYWKNPEQSSYQGS